MLGTWPLTHLFLTYPMNKTKKPWLHFLYFLCPSHFKLKFPFIMLILLRVHFLGKPNPHAVKPHVLFLVWDSILMILNAESTFWTSKCSSGCCRDVNVQWQEWSACLDQVWKATDSEVCYLSNLNTKQKTLFLVTILVVLQSAIIFNGFCFEQRHYVCCFVRGYILIKLISKIWPNYSYTLLFLQIILLHLH